MCMPSEKLHEIHMYVGDICYVYFTSKFCTWALPRTQYKNIPIEEVSNINGGST